MKVFHGSYTKINRIDLSKCEPHKDFGRGFYVTKFREQAEAWAGIIGEKNNGDGYVTEFDYTDGAFAESICKIKRFVKYDEEWLDFIVMNRNKNIPEPAHDYDIVEGPVADDKIQATLRLYLKGKISKEKFLAMLTHHEETHQICFCTGNSLQLIDYTDNIDISCEVSEITEMIIQRLMLDHSMDTENATDLFYSSAIFGNLTDISTGYYKKAWTEIYEVLRQELKI